MGQHLTGHTVIQSNDHDFLISTVAKTKGYKSTIYNGAINKKIPFEYTAYNDNTHRLTLNKYTCNTTKGHFVPVRKDNKTLRSFVHGRDYEYMDTLNKLVNEDNQICVEDKHNHKQRPATTDELAAILFINSNPKTAHRSFLAFYRKMDKLNLMHMKTEFDNKSGKKKEIYYANPAYTLYGVDGKMYCSEEAYDLFDLKNDDGCLLNGRSMAILTTFNLYDKMPWLMGHEYDNLGIFLSRGLTLVNHLLTDDEKLEIYNDFKMPMIDNHIELN